MVKTFEIDGFVFEVGQNAAENWDLYDQSKAFDTWFHLKNVTSGSGFLRSNGLKAPKTVILQAKIILQSLHPTKPAKVLVSPIRKVKKGIQVGSFLTF